MEKKLTLQEVFDRIQKMFGYDMETEEVTEFAMRSLINDVFADEQKILERKTDAFNWNNSKFLEKKCENTIKEICIYTDGNMYAAVSHIEDKCREFKTKEELQTWIDKFFTK